MEDLSVTVIPYSTSVANTIKPTVVTPTVSRSNRTEPNVGNPTEGIGASFGIQDHVPTDIDAAEVKEAVKQLNSQLEHSARSIRFQIDDTTNKIQVFVVDKETGEIVRKIPPEASIRLAANGELSGIFNIQG